MEAFETIAALQEHLKAERSEGKSVGFVPTMGALHDGHLSLLEIARVHNDLSVCSIFVNPTQFNDAEDFRKYPKTLDADRENLLAAGADVLFAPGAEEIYPKDKPVKADFDFGYLEQCMEGTYRKGHFKGVAQVVNRLLDIVAPHTLFLGQKDYQQYLVIREMIRQLQLDIELRLGPIVREPDGLAMSSRNVRLSREQRQQAPVIYQTLYRVKEQAFAKPVGELREWAVASLGATPAITKVDYFEIADAKTLRSLNAWNDAPEIIICTAVGFGPVRLIDNILIP